MKTLTIRKVEESDHEKLRVAAALQGISMEALIRKIIHQVAGDLPRVSIIPVSPTQSGEEKGKENHE